MLPSDFPYVIVKMRIRLLILFLTLFVVAFSRVTWVSAADIIVSNAWLRATIGQANVTAGYFKIENIGAEDDRLLGVTTQVATKAEIHLTTMGEGGVMRMRPVPSLEIPAGQTVALKAGDYHLMMTGIAEPLKEGDRVELTLSFQRAGELSVVATVSRRTPFP